VGVFYTAMLGFAAFTTHLRRIAYFDFFVAMTQMRISTV
jgi:hypothetical protein